MICAANRWIVGRERLRQLLIDADNRLLRFADEFLDPEKLLAAAERKGLEGIVSKRRDQHYRFGKAQRKRRGSPISWTIRLPIKRCWTSRACKRN